MNIKKSLSILSTALVLSSPLLAQDDTLQIDPSTHAFKRAENLFHAARGAKGYEVKKQLFLKAAPQLEQYIRSFPQNDNIPMAKYYLGYSHSQSGNLKQARAQFNSLINTYKKGQAVIYSASYLAHDAGISKDFKSAIAYYKIIAAHSKQEQQVAESYFRIGLCMENLKKHEEAQNYFQESIKRSTIAKSFHQQALLRIAKFHFSKKEYAKALPHFSSASAKDSVSAVRSEAYYYKGLCLKELNHPDKAITALESVLSLQDSGRKPEAVIALMGARYAQGDYKAVAKLAETPGVLLKGNLQGQKDILAGQSYLKLKEYRNAVESFNRVTRLLPNTKEAFEADYRKILCYYNLKSKLVTTQVNNFIRLYGNSYPRSPFMHSALLLQAETLFENKDFKAASNVYKQIDSELLSENRRPGMLYKKAWCHYENKNYRSSVDTFNAYLKTYPEDPRTPTILNIQAQSYIALKDNRSALRLFDQIIKTSPDTPLSAAALQASARILKDQEKYEGMIKRYKILLSSDQELDPVAKINTLYWVAWGEFKLEKYESSLKFTSQAEEIDKGAYAKQLTLLSVLNNYQLKKKAACVKATKKANTIGISHDVPMAVYRWLGIQSFRSEEYGDAETFLSQGIANLPLPETPVSYLRMLGKAQYYNKHYKWAFQTINNAMFLEKDPSHLVELELFKALSQNGLKQPEASKTTTIQALKRKPSGKTKAMLLKLLGDLYFREQNYQQAAISFSSISEFYEDTEILPYAITMVIKSLESSNKPTDAELYRTKLKKEFPNYKLTE